MGTCKSPWFPQPWGHSCTEAGTGTGTGIVPWGQGHRDAPSSGNQRLEFPLVLVAVEVQAVHDLVLLLGRDEVLDDQVPEGWSGSNGEGAGEKRINVTGDRKQVGKREERQEEKETLQGEETSRG